MHQYWFIKCNKCTTVIIDTKNRAGTSLGVQWLGLPASTAGGVGPIPGGETKIPHALWHGQKKNTGQTI